MKKVLSMLVAVVLSLNLCAVAVFADNSDSDADKLFEMLYSDMLNASYESTISIKNNSSWDFIDEIMKAEESSDDYAPAAANYYDLTSQIFDPVDFKILAESAVELSGEMKADYNISENYDKVQMYSKFKLNKPIALNEQLTFSVDTAFEMYMDMDFSDLKNPIYKITINSPLNKKYIYIDYSEVLNQTLSQFSELPVSEELIYSTLQSYIKNMVNAVKESYKKNSTVTYSNQTYTMKMSDAGFKNCIFDVFDVIMNSTDFISLMAVEESDKRKMENDLNSFKESIKYFKNVINKVTILGEDGYTATYKVDNDGKLTEFSTELDISINLYDIACAINDQNMIDYFAPAGKEKCQIDIAVKEDCNILKLGEVTVNYPTLTDENSIDVAKLMKEVLNYYGEDAYQEEDTYTTSNLKYFYGTYDGYRVERNGETYIPARAIAGSFRMFSENITIDESGIVTFTSSNSVPPFKTLAFYENGNSVFIDGVEFWIDNPTFEEDGTTYIPISALKLMNISILYIKTIHSYDVDTGETSVYTAFQMNLEN